MFKSINPPTERWILYLWSKTSCWPYRL